MRIKDAAIRSIAPIIDSYLTDAKRRGVITDDDIREAVRCARYEGAKIPRIVSERSCRMVEAEIVEQGWDR